MKVLIANVNFETEKWGDKRLWERRVKVGSVVEFGGRFRWFE
jgi:hypothetical protein